MAKKDATVSVSRLENGNLQVTVKAANADGSNRVMVMDLSKVHAGNVAYAAFHGFKQRLVDAAAMSADTKTGKPATPAEKADAIEALIGFYESGTEKWSRLGEGGPTGGFLFEALCRKFGHMKAPSEIRAWLDKLDDKAQAALREDDEIAPIIAEIKAEKAKDKPKVDTKGLLSGLTGQ